MLDVEKILNLCDEIKPYIVVIGPEIVLESNLVEECNQRKYNCIGPFKELAQLETSKIFTRNLLSEIEKNKYNPKYVCSSSKTIRKDMQEYLFSNSGEVVIKLDGLASGKGVFVQGDHFDTIEDGIKIVENRSLDNILIEEKLIGEEFSLFTLSDGETFYSFTTNSRL